MRKYKFSKIKRLYTNFANVLLSELKYQPYLKENFSVTSNKIIVLKTIFPIALWEKSDYDKIQNSPSIAEIVLSALSTRKVLIPEKFTTPGAKVMYL